MNETDNTSNKSTQVIGDSIFRVASVCKNFAMFSALLVENESRRQTILPELSMETPVRLLLPEFRLPQSDWDNGGRDITLLMLASHTSGLPRESHLTPFYMIMGEGKADAPTIGALWGNTTSAQVLEAAKNKNLMFAPGQRAA
jgi:CubicO group peptidase (beta-lactamase class C family)